MLPRRGIAKEHQAGPGAKELCRKHGISDATFYKWQSKYGGKELSDARRLRALEAENAKLKNRRDRKRPRWGDFPEHAGRTDARRGVALGDARIEVLLRLWFEQHWRGASSRASTGG
jgi:putative transposase